MRRGSVSSDADGRVGGDVQQLDYFFATCVRDELQVQDEAPSRTGDVIFLVHLTPGSPPFFSTEIAKPSFPSLNSRSISETLIGPTVWKL